MTATLSLATPTFWLRLSMVARLMMPFKDLVFITSERDCPCSAFLPLVFVLHKEVSAVLDMPAFDAALGDGAAAECRLILAPRWNMTGRPPAGRKVGFLDRHHIYMAFVDPFFRKLGLDWDDLLGAGERNAAVTDLVEWACPDSGGGADFQHQRSVFRLNFDAFCSGTGPFEGAFDRVPPLPPGCTLTIKDISGWIASTGAHAQRLALFESNAKKSVLYTDAAKQLLSVSITGSMDVERAAKPLKHSVLIKERAAMSVGMADIALRAGINLHFLQAAKEKLQERRWK